MDTLPAAVPHMESHVLQHLLEHRKGFPPGTCVSPLFVAVQGPQGSGKTFLTNCIQKSIEASSEGLKVVVLSIDDLYLPHEGLVSVAQANPDNRLLKGRGQPGTHDVELGTRLLTRLKHINDNNSKETTIEVPIFDKSQFNGEGDRLPHGTVVQGPIDIVLFEGWCVGFHPITVDEINKRWELPVPGLSADFFKRKGFRKEDVLNVNDRLRSYVPWWSFFDLFIQVSIAAKRFPILSPDSTNRSNLMKPTLMCTYINGDFSRNIT